MTNFHNLIILFVLLLLECSLIVVEGFRSFALSSSSRQQQQRRLSASSLSSSSNNKLFAAADAASAGSAAAAAALEVDATSEVVVVLVERNDEESSSSLLLLFLREVGAIAVPRGVAPGCLSSSGCPIIIIVVEDNDDCQQEQEQRWKTILESTPIHRRSDLVWVVQSSTTAKVPLELYDWQKDGTVVVLIRETNNYNYCVHGKHAAAMKTTILNNKQRQGESPPTTTEVLVSEIESWDSLCDILAAEQTPDATATTANINDSENLNNDDDNHPSLLVSIPAIDLICTGISNTENYQTQTQSTTEIQSVIVVGGGILGSSIARALKQRDVTADVTLYDPTPTGLATPASWAWLNANSKPPQQYKSLNQMGLRGWRLDPLLSQLQSLKWSGTIVKTTKQLESTTGGYNIEGPLTPQRIQELEPYANFTTTTTIDDDDSSYFFYYFADEGHVDPRDAVSALRQEATDMGVSIVQDRVVELMRDSDDNADGRVVGVKTLSGQQQFANVVIVAAGANSSDTTLVGESGVPLVHNPSKTYFGDPIPTTSTSSSTPPKLNRTLVDMTQSIYLAQRPDGTVVAGGGAIKFPKDEPQHVMKAQAVAETLAPKPVQNSPLTHAREVVSKPMPQDGFPILGLVQPGLYASVSHSGMTLSPLVGQLVAAEVLERVSLDILEDYRPSRFDRQKESDSTVRDWQEAETSKKQHQPT